MKSALLPILVLCFIFSFELKAQNIYTCINPKKNTKSVELKDSAGNTILTYIQKRFSFHNTNRRILFQNNVYNISRYGYRVVLFDSLKNTNSGVIKQSWSVKFTYEGHKYRTTGINKKGYNFTLKSENDDEVCKVKFSETLLENNFEIHNLTNPELLPFVFMVSLLEFENYKERKKWPLYSVIFAYSIVFLL